MTQPSETRESSGLAASIQRLFESEAAAPPVEAPADSADAGARDMAWVAESGVRLPGDVNAPDPLLKAVRAYLLAEDPDRDERRAELRAAGEDAQASRAGVSLADAVEILGRFGERRADALELAREMTNPGVATLLVERLGTLQDVERRDELAACLPELGEEVGYALLEALREEALDVDADRSQRRMLLRLLSAVAERHPVLLEEMIEDPNWRVVRNAVPLVVELGGDGALQQLTAALGHERAEVRKEALNALGQVGGNDAGALAIGALEDSDPGVRAQAARSLGLMNTERALRPMISQLEDESEPAVQVELIRSLGVLGDPSAVIPIEKRISSSLFSRPPREVRLVGYRALAAIGTPHATGLIEKAVTDKDPEVQNLARTILESRK